jgi:23S rRNA pseudouridine955/2504/2580 synthase
MKKQKFSDLIVWENEQYLLINKPYDIATLDERDSSRPSILRMARDYCPSVKVCHRLDKETSGILLLAKDPEAYRHASIQFEHRLVEKVYHAIINGLPNWLEIQVNLPIAPSGKSHVRIDYEQGKPSETFFRVLQSFEAHTLVACMPHTGRMHQIRIHLAAIKSPIVADNLYGGAPIYLSSLKRKYKFKEEEAEEPISRRVALHARSLAFTDEAGNRIFAEATYPKDFRVMLQQLDRQ